MLLHRLLAQDLADESSPYPDARAQAGLILKNHLTSKDYQQVFSPTFHMCFDLSILILLSLFTFDDCYFEVQCSARWIGLFYMHLPCLRRGTKMCVAAYLFAGWSKIDENLWAGNRAGQ